MIEGERIRVWPQTGWTMGWVYLEGTVLSIHVKDWFHETRGEIPLELLSVKVGRSLRGAYLLQGAAVWVAVLLCASAFFLLLKELYPLQEPLWFQAFLWVSGAGGGSVFLVYLAKFLIPLTSLKLFLEPAGKIQVFARRKEAHAIRRIVQAIEKRKEWIEANVPYPMEMSVGTERGGTWVSRCFMAYAIAAVVSKFGWPWLYWACLIPFAGKLREAFISLRMPKTYRRAVKAFDNEEWDKAEKAVEEFIAKNPSSLQAKTFLMAIRARASDFEGAYRTLAEIEKDLDTALLQELQFEIALCERIHARKQMARNVN